LNTFEPLLESANAHNTTTMQHTQITPTRKHAAINGSTQQTNNLFPGLPDTSQLSDDQFMQWGMANPGAFNDSFSAFNNQFTTPSTQLIRRNTEQQVATANQGYNGTMLSGGGGGLDMQMDGVSDTPTFVESNEELEKRAAAAKKDAQSRSPPKNIPPFIQKLSK